MDVGARLTELRTAVGMSQYALAKRTGIAQGSLSQYESGLKTPGVDTLERICMGLGIALSDFFKQEQNKNVQIIALNSQEWQVISDFRALTQERQKDVAIVLRCLSQQKEGELQDKDEISDTNFLLNPPCPEGTTMNETKDRQRKKEVTE